MAHEFKMQRRVEFAETDTAGIVHFSNFFRYMESAEHAFFRSLGLRVHSHSESKIGGWARVNAACTYKSPLRNEDLVDVHLIVREKRTKSFIYDAVFTKQEDGKSIEVAHGSMTTVCIKNRAGDDALEATAIPKEVDALIEAAPPELVAEFLASSGRG
ncbi:MAG: 4-hydroxybenzoyl-CoA thioesterase [Planctomycetes bacterium]|nr:4-hydroxybenzoyl-CoA thioesterase [Planctomycetota bacterium]